jgi:ATP/maltotriose-dependent transcriptional regulator MalT
MGESVYIGLILSGATGLFVIRIDEKANPFRGEHLFGVWLRIRCSSEDIIKYLRTSSIS